jgi:hypothetical protein
MTASGGRIAAELNASWAVEAVATS